MGPAAGRARLVVPAAERHRLLRRRPAHRRRGGRGRCAAGCRNGGSSACAKRVLARSRRGRGLSLPLVLVLRGVTTCHRGPSRHVSMRLHRWTCRAEGTIGRAGSAGTASAATAAPRPAPAPLRALFGSSSSSSGRHGAGRPSSASARSSDGGQTPRSPAAANQAVARAGLSGSQKSSQGSG